MYFTIIYFRPF